MTAELKVARRETRLREAVREVLEESLGEGFEEVIIFGFKNGKIQRKHSGCNDRLKLLGALQAAILETWNDH